MTISYDNILATVKDLASYEAGRLKDGSGNSMYEDVRIGAQDETAVLRFIGVAATEMSGSLHSCEIKSDGAEVTISFADEANLAIPTEDTFVHALASQVMALWLQDKDTARSEAYKLITETMTLALRRGIRRKRPKLK